MPRPSKRAAAPYRTPLRRQARPCRLPMTGMAVERFHPLPSPCGEPPVLYCLRFDASWHFLPGGPARPPRCGAAASPLLKTFPSDRPHLLPRACPGKRPALPGFAPARRQGCFRPGPQGIAKAAYHLLQNKGECTNHVFLFTIPFFISCKRYAGPKMPLRRHKNCKIYRDVKSCRNDSQTPRAFDCPTAHSCAPWGYHACQQRWRTRHAPCRPALLAAAFSDKGESWGFPSTTT